MLSKSLLYYILNAENVLLQILQFGKVFIAKSTQSAVLITFMCEVGGAVAY